MRLATIALLLLIAGCAKKKPVIHQWQSAFVRSDRVEVLETGFVTATRGGSETTSAANAVATLSAWRLGRSRYASAAGQSNTNSSTQTASVSRTVLTRESIYDYYIRSGRAEYRATYSTGSGPRKPRLAINAPAWIAVEGDRIRVFDAAGREHLLNISREEQLPFRPIWKASTLSRWYVDATDEELDAEQLEEGTERPGFRRIEARNQRGVYVGTARRRENCNDGRSILREQPIELTRIDAEHFDVSMQDPAPGAILDCNTGLYHPSNQPILRFKLWLESK